MTTSDPAPANPSVLKSVRVDPAVWKRFRHLCIDRDLEAGPALALLLDAFDATSSETASAHGSVL